MVNPRLALRTLFRTPFVTIVAILSLALGIGANVAIFSLFDTILLRSLPVADPGGLVNLAAPGPKPGMQSCNQAGDCESAFSYPMFRDLERAQKVFTGIAAHRLFGANLAYHKNTQSGDAMMVSGSYFATLGLQPAIGQLINGSHDRTPGESRVAVLGYDYWATRFGSNPRVINDTIVVNGEPMTILGVAPRGFDGTTLGSRPQVYVPITMNDQMQRYMVAPGRPSVFENRRAYWVYAFARLKPGVSIERARAALNVAYHAVINDIEAPLQKGMSDKTLKQFRARQVTLEPGSQGQTSMRKSARDPLLMLMGVTALVLLIACANIANLLLARGATRAGEMAVRLSIGAGRRHLVAQLLTESCLLAVLGGLAGLLVARWTINLILSLLPSDAATALPITLNGTAMLFAAALSLGTGVLFGLFPALHATRPDLAGTLKGQAGHSGSTRSAAWVRSALVTAQITLSMALLIGAGLFVKSLANVSRVDLGMNTERVVTFGIAPELNGYKPERSAALFERLEDELAAIPGVTNASAAIVPALAGDNWGKGVSVEGFEAGPDTDNGSRFNEVAPDYFHTMGIRLLAGREFTRADAAKSPKVAIVNEEFARKFNLGRTVVGKRMSQQGEPQSKLDTEIVGLVQNAKYSDVKDKIPPQFFIPYRQDETIGQITFYVRTSLDTEQLFPAVRKTLERADPDLPVQNLRTLTEQVRQSVFLDRFITTLSTAFAVLATLLAAIGLYGVLAYAVAQRTREIGLRMALGAAPRAVQTMVLKQVAWMTLVGGLIGIAAAFALGRYAKSLLFEMQAYDPVVFVAAAVALTLVALAAGFIPALRASRIDPMLALRYE
ncbi:MAG: ABC transporter permease [Bacteroidales bacterium]